MLVEPKDSAELWFCIHYLQSRMIYVTHDQVEAMNLADRFVLLRDGIIEQRGAPLELYERPVNKFVAEFIGSPAMNFIPATLEVDDAAPCVRLAGGERLKLPAARAGEFAGVNGLQVLLGIRPEHIHRQRDGATKENYEALPIKIEIIEPMGTNTLINFHLGDTSVLARLDAYANEQPGAELTLLIDMNRAILVDPESEKVL